MRNVNTWVEIWRCFNVILGGILVGLFVRYITCILQKTRRIYIVHSSIPIAMTLLALAIIVGTITNLRIGVGLTLAVPLCTLGELAGIRGMLDLVGLRKDSTPNKDNKPKDI